MNQLVHGLWTPLADKATAVAGWPGYTQDDVDAAIQAARDDGTIAGYEKESPGNQMLDLVFIPYRKSVPATLLYLLERAKEVWGEDHPRWKEVYDEGVDDNRVKLIPGARPFTPNRLVLVAIDFGANLNPKDGTVLQDVQARQAANLEDFGVIANAIESPDWVRAMNGPEVPCAITAALLLNVSGCEVWSNSPLVDRRGGRLHLDGHDVEDRFRERAMPVRRQYQP